MNTYSSDGLIHTGSWKVHIGKVKNQYVHIWMYKNFAHLDEFIDNSKSCLYYDKLNEYILQHSNQICQSFSYFGMRRKQKKKVFFFTFSFCKAR